MNNLLLRDVLSIIIILSLLIGFALSGCISGIVGGHGFWLKNGHAFVKLNDGSHKNINVIYYNLISLSWIILLISFISGIINSVILALKNDILNVNDYYKSLFKDHKTIRWIASILGLVGITGFLLTILRQMLNI